MTATRRRTDAAGLASAAIATIGPTLALAAVTLSVALGLGRLFEGKSHLLPLVAATAVAHGVMWAGRRLGLPLVLSALAALGAVGVAGGSILLTDTTTFGLPGPATLDAARQALSESWGLFGDVVAPTPATDGFLLAAMIGVAVTAVLADWAAFRMGVLFEAVVPSFTLFVFTAMLGTRAGRPVAVAAYLAALMLFLVVQRAALEATGTSWFASRTRGGTGALLRGAAVLGTVAVLAAVVVGPRLPGAAADAVLSWRDSGPDGDGRRTTVSPLVDIRGRLVDQSTTEVFTVRASQKAYWRITSLDTFNGQIWSSDASYRPVGERLPTRATAPDTNQVVQDFTISGLSSIWLPAAYQPQAIDGLEDVSYNADLGSLITGEDTTDGLTYQVVSAVPRLTRAQLATDRRPVRSPDLVRFVQLPPVSNRVVDLAHNVAGNSDGSAYGLALALQSFFRENFTYSLDTGGGHDEAALETFLFNSQTGYCEQFAGAYAVLARILGLPTRVAVGFTPGEQDAEGTYHVRGLNAHAWPEVFLAGTGWVAFEPTPGRGAPGALDYLGIPEQQASPDDTSTATTAAPPTTAAADPATPSTTSAPADVATGDVPEGDEARPLRRHPLVVAGLVTLLILVTMLAGVPLAKAVRRRRRRSAAATAADRVWVAWSEAADAVSRAGAPRWPAETLAEHARRAGPTAGLPDEAAEALTTLAGDAAEASYGAGPVADETADRAARLAVAVERSVAGGATKRQRLLWSIDPRPLRPGGRDAAT
jgi:transglutaminase-like putative cysteine protease